MIDLPHSAESERAVLAAGLLSPSLLPDLATRLEPDDFFEERHQILWLAYLDLMEQDKPVDLRTVQAALEEMHRRPRGKKHGVREGGLDLVGGIAYLVGLDGFLPDLRRIRTYAAIVKDRSRRRQMIKLGAEMMAAGAEPPVELVEVKDDSGRSSMVNRERPLDRVIGDFADRLEDLAASGQTQAAAVAIADAAERALTQVVDVAEGRAAPRIMTGLVDFDRLTGGLGPGNLVVVAARPGGGKSTMALGWALDITRADDKRVLIVSLEMTAEELALKALSALSEVPSDAIKRGELSPYQCDDVAGALDRLRERGIYVADKSDATMAHLRKIVKEIEPDVVMVDYLQLMDGKGENRQVVVSGISRSLKRLAMKEGIPVIALSQLSRETERRGDHRPQLADLRESGAIEQDADLVAFIYRDELYNPDDPEVKGLAELILRKNRHGNTGTVDLAFIAEISKFRALDRWR